MPRKSPAQQSTNRKAASSVSLKRKRRASIKTTTNRTDLSSSASNASDTDVEPECVAEQQPPSKMTRRSLRNCTKTSMAKAAKSSSGKRGNDHADDVSTKKALSDAESDLLNSDEDDDWDEEVEIKRRRSSVKIPKPKEQVVKKEPVVKAKRNTGAKESRKASSKTAKTKSVKKEPEANSSESEDDWIEVDGQDKKPTINESDLIEAVNRLNNESEGRSIELVLDPDSRKVGNKLSRAELERRRNAAQQRAILDNQHKVNLLCLIAVQQHALRVCESGMIRALALSILPATLALNNGKNLHTVESLRKLLTWFSDAFELITEEKKRDGETKARCMLNDALLRPFLLTAFSTRRQLSCSARCDDCVTRTALLFYTFCAALDLPVRLVCTFLCDTQQGAKLERASTVKRWLELTLLDRSTSTSRSIAVSPAHALVDDITELRRNLLSGVTTRNSPHIFAIGVGDRNTKEKPRRKAAKSKERKEVKSKLEFRIRDVTARYYPEALCRAALRAQRLQSTWLAHFLNQPDADELAELEASLRAQPLPTSHADLKNHPIYVLASHLTKYQCVYDPAFAAVRRAPSAPTRRKPKYDSDDSDADVRECTARPSEQGFNAAEPVGFLKDVPFFLRSFITELHTRETWLKGARVVRDNERPFKTVRGRQTKSSKARGIERQTELFGEWQTKVYDPPTAQNGCVPKNDFGNVYLFRPEMLPRGCVQLKFGNALRSVARRLKIDVAPALIGWEIARGGFSVPTYDGFIVCQEHAQILTDAYHGEMTAIEAKRRQRARQQKRDKWLLLVGGALQRQRIILAVGFEPSHVSASCDAPNQQDANGNVPSTSKYFEQDEEKAVVMEDGTANVGQTWPRNREFVGEAQLSLFNSKKRVHDDLLDSDSD